MPKLDYILLLTIDNILYILRLVKHLDNPQIPPDTRHKASVKNTLNKYMTKKDYIKIANTIAQCRADLGNYYGFSTKDREEMKEITQNIIDRFANMLQSDNERFDRNKFLEYISKH